MFLKITKQSYDLYIDEFKLFNFIHRACAYKIDFLFCLVFWINYLQDKVKVISMLNSTNHINLETHIVLGQ
jgi:hypothetical protein